MDNQKWKYLLRKLMHERVKFFFNFCSFLKVYKFIYSLYFVFKVFILHFLLKNSYMINFVKVIAWFAEIKSVSYYLIFILYYIYNIFFTIKLI